MLNACRKSCNLCDKTPQQMDRLLEEFQQKELIDKVAETPYGVEQKMEPKASDLLERMQIYMEDTVLVDSTFAAVRDDCKLRHEKCVLWAFAGECEAVSTARSPRIS